MAGKVMTQETRIKLCNNYTRSSDFSNQLE